MTSQEVLTSDVIDILFEKRNKLYGAYELRRHYANRLWTAIIVAFAFCSVVLFFVSSTSSDRALIAPVEPIVRTVVIDPYIPKPPEPPAPPAAVEAATVKAASVSLTDQFKLVENPDLLKQMQAIKDLDQLAISSVNQAGPIVEGVPVIPAPETSTVAKITHSGGEDFVAVEKQPEFPGGREAWARFLNRYLQTPAELQAGEKRVVHISFVVDVDGSITRFKVLQSGGSVFDNEVIRVLKKMPKWKAAIQNGRAIAVTFTQPVTFVGVEQ